MNVPTYAEIREALRIPEIYQLDIPIMTRIEARAKGLSRYFTGNMCKHGHVAERDTRNGGCIECIRTNYELRRGNNEAE